MKTIAQLFQLQRASLPLKLRRAFETKQLLHLEQNFSARFGTGFDPHYVRDRRDFLTRIGEFAGRPVPEEVLAEATDAKRRNPAQSAFVLGAKRGLNRFGPRNELNPAPLVESSVVHGLATKMRKKLDPANVPITRPLAERSEAALKQAVADAVGDRYVESNRKTAELLGVDLAAYGWML